MVSESFRDIVVNGSTQVDPVMVTVYDMVLLVVLVLVIVFLFNYFQLGTVQLPQKVEK